jgi:RimJ/RimL family protein N-acetyltransferase
VNISHRSLPTLTEQRDYIENHTYQSWDIIWVENNRVGNIYLTQRDEVGIFIDSKFQARGYGSQALKQFMEKNGKKRYLANINPTNYKSIQFFGKHGFIHIQNTYHKKFD